jgi:antitoxin ParD1/3/4
MHISLPDALKPFIDQQMATGRYASPSAYIEALIRNDERHQAETRLLEQVKAGEPLPVDEHFDARLEALLQEAEDSGVPEEMTKEDWERIRQEGLALYHKRHSANG